MRPFFIFSDEKPELRNGDLIWSGGDRTKYNSGMPDKNDILAGRGLGFRYCTIAWITPGYTIVCTDFIDLYRLLR